MHIKNSLRARIVHGVYIAVALVVVGSVIVSVPTSNAARTKLSYSQTIGDGGELREANGVALDTSGNIYVADSAHDRIVKFSSAGAVLSSFGSTGSGPGQFNYPTKIAIDQAGDIYVVDAGNSRVVKLSADGTYIMRIGSLGGGPGKFNSPASITTDQTGNVYIATDGNRVQKFDTNGNFLLQWGSLGVGDGQTIILLGVRAAGGYIYTVDQGLNRVQKFDTNGNFISKWGAFGYTDGRTALLSAAAFDSAGNMYVTDESSRVQKIDANGNFDASTGWADSGDGQLGYTTDVAVTSGGKVIVADMSHLKVYSQSLIYAPNPVSSLSVSNVTQTGATFTWQVPASDGGSPITQYSVYTRKVGRAAWTYYDSVSSTTHAINVGEPFEAGVPYEVKVIAVNNIGDSRPTIASFATTTLPPHVLNSVMFETVGGQKRMVLHGQDLIYGTDGYYDAQVHSMVSLNGAALPFCAAPYTSDQLINDSGVDPSLFSNQAPCYQFEDQNHNPLFTTTQAVIELPDNFDVHAAGTVSVDGSNTYHFHIPVPVITPPAPATPPTPVQSTTAPAATSITRVVVSDPSPTTQVDDSVALPAAPSNAPLTVNGKEVTDTPTISSLPSFSGKAKPYSTVTVTVHSDPVTCTTKADGNGDWTCTLPKSLPLGNHTVALAVVTPDNQVTNFGPYPVHVASISTSNSTATNNNPAVTMTKPASRPLPWNLIIAAVIVIGAAVTIAIVRHKRR